MFAIHVSYIHILSDSKPVLSPSYFGRMNPKPAICSRNPLCFVSLIPFETSLPLAIFNNSVSTSVTPPETEKQRRTFQYPQGSVGIGVILLRVAAANNSICTGIRVSGHHPQVYCILFTFNTSMWITYLWIHENHACPLGIFIKFSTCSTPVAQLLDFILVCLAGLFGIRSLKLT